MNILDRLFQLKDDKYRNFVSRLIPNINKNTIIGVRVPLLRSFAKELVKSDEYIGFLNDLPHKYYDENELHSLIISQLKNYDECFYYLERFLPYIDNWAVCDIISVKVSKNNKDKLMKSVNKWLKSKHSYTVRFAISVIMINYLDSDYKKENLELVSNIKNDEYYVKMMIAWFFQVALYKRWDDAIKYLEDNKLDIWIHNMTIQKSVQSFRITNIKKEYLKKLKR